MSKQAHYGDQVYIEISSLKPLPETDSRILFSNGFLEEKIYAVKAHNLSTTNFRPCIFNVLPSLVDSKEDLDTLNSFGTELAFLSTNRPDTVGEMYLQNKIQYKGEQIELSKDSLEALNKKIMREMDNQTLCYGDVILLQHLESGYYLAAEPTCHPNNPNFCHLKLQKERTSACYFRFFSYSIPTDRSAVDYESDMKLISVHLNSCVTMGEIKSPEDKFEFITKCNEPIVSSDASFPADTLKRAHPLSLFGPEPLIVGTVLEADENNKIRLQEFCSRSDQILFNKKKIIKNGDYVRFQLDDFYLTASTRPTRQNFGLYSQQMEKTEASKYSCLNSIFQIVEIVQPGEYPLGQEIHSSAKQMENENDKAKYYLKHFATGQFLTVPREGMVNCLTINDGTEEKPDQAPTIPHFNLINSHKKNQNDSLTQNSRVALHVFKDKEDIGEYYLESNVEKHTIMQLDLNTSYFVGFKNTEDKIRDKLKQVKKIIKGNETVGSYFKVSLVGDDEMRKMLELEAYANALVRFMEVLQQSSVGSDIITPSYFADELNKVAKYTEELAVLVNSKNIQIQILAREFCILDIVVRFLYYFLTGNEIDNAIVNMKIDVKQATQFLKNLANIILKATKMNEITHRYLSQYVRVFIVSHYNPSLFFSICNSSQSDILKGTIVRLLHRFLWDKDYDTLGQLCYYKENLFDCLKNHEDYSIHFLEVMVHYFDSKCPNLENTLRENFIMDYLAEEQHVKKMFPRLSSLETEQDFQIEFERKDYPNIIKLSSAPSELLKYIIWIFRLINTLASRKSFKFSSFVIEYYNEQLCEDLVNSSITPSNLKNEILKMLRYIHFSYQKLPFDSNIPPKIQILLGADTVEKYLATYRNMIRDSQQELIQSEEKMGIAQMPCKKRAAENVSLQQLSLELLRGEFEKIQTGKFDSLSFTLEVMKGLLRAPTSMSYEILYLIHHSLATLIERASQELSNKQEGLYYKPFIENAEKIFYVLSQVDDYMGELAFGEAIASIKTKVLQVKTVATAPGSILISNHIATASSSHAVLENDIMQSILSSMSKEWKSKQKLYFLAGKYNDIYSEERVMKSLWKIVESDNVNLTNAAVTLIKNKTLFDCNVARELHECVLITEESEVNCVMKLISNLLNLNKIGRKLQIAREFSISEKEKESIFDEIIQNCEDIFLSIYDYENHMKEENKDITKEEAKNVFIDRLHYSKSKGSYEVPFKCKPECIKSSYQKILNVLRAHEILVPYFRRICFKDNFLSMPESKIKLAMSLITLILTLFLYRNTTNQNLLSRFNEFITSFYKTEIIQSSNEVVALLAELCRDNKKLLKMTEEHLFKPYAYTLVGYLRPFSVYNQQANANVPLPIIYMKSLPVLLSAGLPLNMFDPMEIMKEKFFDFYKFMCQDNRLSLKELVKNKQVPNFLNDLKLPAKHVEGFSSEIQIDMPIFYTTLKELLESECAFMLTDVKEQALALQKSFTLEQVMPFLTNENIECNFELKKLTLKMVENLYFKNIHKSTSVFPNYKEFLSFTSVLLIDIYGYLNHHLPNSDQILKVFPTYDFLSEQNKQYIQTYNGLLNVNLDEIIYLHYQSIVSFREIWEDYINYVLCNLFGKLIIYFKDFMLAKTDKNKGSHCIFDVWLNLIVKVREMNRGSQMHIDEALKSVIIHSEYSKYKDSIYSILEKDKKIRPTNSSTLMDQVKWKLDLDFLLNKYLGKKSDYKAKFIGQNLSDIAKILTGSKSVLKKLVHVLKSGEIPTKDVLFILKLFRRLIESLSQIESNKEKSVDTWTDIPYNELKKINHYQTMLDSLGIVEVIFSLFYQYEDNQDVLKEVLLLSIAMLFGGNKTMQNSFFEQFREDYKNEVIDRLAYILETSWEAFRITEGRKTKAAHLSAIRYIFDYLIDHPKSQIIMNEKHVQIPEKIKQELAENYKREQVKEKENQLSNPANESVNLSFIILKFFQTLCEGHYFNFQEFLRDQTLFDHSKSSNIPEFLRQTYHTYVKEIRIDNVGIGSQILALIAELEQGEAQENVSLLLKKTFINDLCFTLNGFNNDLDLLSRGFLFNANHPQLMLIKSKALGILKDLIERADAADLKRIRQEINLRSLVYTFKENLIAFHQKIGVYPERKLLVAEDIWSPDLSNAFTIYFILKHLSFEDTTDELTDEIQELLTQVFSDDEGISRIVADRYISRFFRQYTGSIEIIKKKSSRILKIYFPISVLYYYLKQESKDIFSEKVDRSNIQTKIAGLMEGSKELISQMYDEYNSRKSFLGLNFNSLYFWVRLLTNILALTITFFNLFQLEWIDENVVYKNETSITSQRAINSIQAALSFALIILWLKAKLKRHITFMWDDYVSNNVKEEGALRQDIIHKLDHEVTPEIGEAVLRLKGPFSQEWEYVQHLMSKKKILTDFSFLFQNTYFLWHLCYFGICVASSFHPLVTAFQLFDIVIRSDTVNRITLSISKNASQFLWTLVLLFVTVYIYSFIGLYFLHERYHDEDVGDLCRDAYSCLLASLDFGLRSGGGIADALEKVQYDPENKGIYLGHVLFDLSFFILMITLLLNLIFGMIIDAFGELRDEKTLNEDDKLNICFICGLSRSEYERTASFDKHIFEEHNMWQYLAYIVYLQQKNKAFPTDLTDVESYVLDRYNKRDYDWIPIGRSLSLERHFTDEERDKRSEAAIIRDDVIGALQAIGEQNKQLMMRLNELFVGNRLINEKGASCVRSKPSLKKGDGLTTIKTDRSQTTDNKV